MCGILGGNIQEWNYDEGIRALRHRGPNGERVEQFEDFMLAFSRLAIMDLSENAMQPMKAPDREVYIVFNGEIYGFDRLKQALSKKYIFLTTSDTEVVLYAYLEYGDNFINQIDGMFAIAIYDRRSETVKLFRDRMGIKPLYYFVDCGKFAFASELKAIIESGKNYKWEYDETAVYDYLFYQYIPEPKSLYRNIYKLKPGHKLYYDVREKRVVLLEKYWKLHINTSVTKRRKRESILEEARYLIKESIKEQMVADVPVGTFLSGGIDSSIITYECSKINPEIESHTIGFNDSKYDETEFAKMMIEKYRLASTIKYINKSDIELVKGNMKEWYDEPFSDTSAYPTYILSQLARQKNTVVLTGDGGDEVFGGYERYEYYKNIHNKFLLDNRRLERFAYFVAQNKWPAYHTAINHFKTRIALYSNMFGAPDAYVYSDIARQWGIPKDYDPLWHYRSYYNKDIPLLTSARYLDFKTYLPGAILTKLDRVSMAVGLEARVPFLSRKIVEFAFSLSEQECYLDGKLKGILKIAYEDIIPKPIINRRKKGFSVPRQYLKKEYADKLFLGILKNEWYSVWDELNSR